jgi:hypothetical protein
VGHHELLEVLKAIRVDKEDLVSWVIVVGKKRIGLSNIIAQALAGSAPNQSRELSAFRPKTLVIVDNLLDTILTDCLDGS